MRSVTPEGMAGDHCWRESAGVHITVHAAVEMYWQLRGHAYKIIAMIMQQIQIVTATWYNTLFRRLNCRQMSPQIQYK